MSWLFSVSDGNIIMASASVWFYRQNSGLFFNTDDVKDDLNGGFDDCLYGDSGYGMNKGNGR
ncbi:hypothetical protein DZJ_39150 [Dickeya ananatis]